MNSLTHLGARLASALAAMCSAAIFASCSDLPHEGPHVFVSGNALDGVTQAPIESVLVALRATGGPYDTYTDDLGAFTVTSPPFDSMRLTATKFGYVDTDTLLLDVDVSIDGLTLYLRRE